MLAVVCGLEIHSSFSAVLWVVLSAPELGADRKITAQQEDSGSSLIRNVGQAGSLSTLSVVTVYVSNTLK